MDHATVVLYVLSQVVISSWPLSRRPSWRFCRRQLLVSAWPRRRLSSGPLSVCPVSTPRRILQDGPPPSNVAARAPAGVLFGAKQRQGWEVPRAKESPKDATGPGWAMPATSGPVWELAKSRDVGRLPITRLNFWPAGLGWRGGSWDLLRRTDGACGQTT